MSGTGFVKATGKQGKSAGYFTRRPIAPNALSVVKALFTCRVEAGAYRVRGPGSNTVRLAPGAEREPEDVHLEL
jgi:hypothetical protein